MLQERYQQSLECSHRWVRFKGEVIYLDSMTNWLTYVNVWLAVTLELWFNQLSGTIPTTLGSLSALQTLALSLNKISGTIKLTTLRQLVSGEILNCLALMHYITRHHSD